MTKLLQSFFTFEKLMKEKLVVALFWLAIINVSLVFVGLILDHIHLGPLAFLFFMAAFVLGFITFIVAARLVSELAIAIFRINDNVSPDGGRSETSDIDLLKETLKATEEARKAAEAAAKKASAATLSVVGRGRSSDKDDDYIMSEGDIDPDKDVIIDAKPSAKQDIKPDAPKKPQAETPPAEKPAAKKPATTKKPASKKTTAAKAKTSETDPKPKLNKDGTPRKKTGPKPKP